MRTGRVIATCLIILGVLCGYCASALAAAEGPGWQLFADTYPTNLVKPVDEIQKVLASTQTGTFTLTYRGAETDAIHSHASDAEVQSELEALPGVGAGNVSVSGGTPGTYTVEFVGALGNTKVAELEASGADVMVTTAGFPSGTIGIEVFNIGAGASSGPITVTDTLPPDVKAKEAGQLIYLENGEGHFGVEPRIEPGSWACTGNGPSPSPSVAGATVVTCVDEEAFAGGGGLPTFRSSASINNPQPAVGITVEAPVEAAGLSNRVSIAGGGALEPAATTDPVTISSSPAAGGVARADAWFSNANGTLDRQAGSHPYAATFAFNAATAVNGEHLGYFPGGEIRNLETIVPAGLIGDLQAMPRCTRERLFGGNCPPASMVGLLKAPNFATSVQKQVFNMVPPPGVAAELGFEYAEVPVYITFKVRTGGDYAIVARVNNIPQREVFQSVLTLWGVPAERSHDRWRSQEGGCSQEEMNDAGENKYCLTPEAPTLTPFLTLPTSCAEPEAPGFAFRELAGWQEADAESEATFPMHDGQGRPAGFTGCETLTFEPAISVSPDTGKADTPAGLTVEVKPPLGGLQEVTGDSSADIKDTTFVLPSGMAINPGQAAGLQACGPAEDGLTTEAEKVKGEEDDGPAQCPNASKVGTVTIKTPLIESDEEKQFEGDVYVLQSNPPELKLLVAASADGVNLKLVGVASLCEAVGETLDGKTCEAVGQVITAFDDTPQLPFTLFKLSFSGGAQAALDTPAKCGRYTASADFTPWSTPSTQDFLTDAAFTLSEGSGASPCPSSTLPFSPELTAGSTTDQAGGYTDFSMLLRRGDDQQRIAGLQFKAPEGLTGFISKVPLCSNAQAEANACPESSKIGHTVVESGPGPSPLVVPEPGRGEAPIYLTESYDGAPFGLSIVVPLQVGPFDLPTQRVRARIEIDPHTSALTITTNELPQEVAGVPTDLREIDAVIERPEFMVNPTNCNPQEFTGTAYGAAAPGQSEAGKTAAIASRFGMGSCQQLKFQPQISVSTSGHTSRINGASLTYKIAYPNTTPGTQADIGYVKTELPVQLPSRLPTLRKACTQAQFRANPADCPPASVVGHATVHTPLLPVALEGPVYFVSNGGEAFPNLIILLQGDGVGIELVGDTFISNNGVTSTTFHTVPDDPFSTFELTLPQGPYSALAANVNLCKPTAAVTVEKKVAIKVHGRKKTVMRDVKETKPATPTMPTELVGQNGAVDDAKPAVAVTGCARTTRKAAKQKHKRPLKRNKHPGTPHASATSGICATNPVTQARSPARTRPQSTPQRLIVSRHGRHRAATAACRRDPRRGHQGLPAQRAHADGADGRHRRALPDPQRDPAPVDRVQRQRSSARPGRAGNEDHGSPRHVARCERDHDRHRRDRQRAHHGCLRQGGERHLSRSESRRRLLAALRRASAARAAVARDPHRRAARAGVPRSSHPRHLAVRRVVGRGARAADREPPRLPGAAPLVCTRARALVACCRRPAGGRHHGLGRRRRDRGGARRARARRRRQIGGADRDRRNDCLGALGGAHAALPGSHHDHPLLRPARPARGLRRRAAGRAAGHRTGRAARRCAR